MRSDELEFILSMLECIKEDYKTDNIILKALRKKRNEKGLTTLEKKLYSYVRSHKKLVEDFTNDITEELENIVGEILKDAGFEFCEINEQEKEEK